MALVVIDFGSSYVRAGIAGELSPRAILPSDVLSQDQSLLEISIMEMFASIIHQLVTARSKEIKVLILEHISQPRRIREAVVLVLLKYYKVAAICLYPSLFTPIVCTSRKYGIVMDLGSRETRAIAVYDNRFILSSLAISPSGASSLTRTQPIMLAQVEEWLLTSATSHPLASEAVQTYLGTSDEVEDEMGGAPGALLECLLQCSCDVRAVSAQVVIYCGGGANIAGLPEKIAEVARQRAHDVTRYEPLRKLLDRIDQRRTSSSAETPNRPTHQQPLALMPHPLSFPPAELAWVGGSLLASTKGINHRFVRDKDLLRVGQDTDEHKREASPMEGTVAMEHKTQSRKPAAAVSRITNRVVCHLPDWQSVSENDWRFAAPVHPLFASSLS